MAYGLVIQFHPKIKGELLDYVLNEVMKCNDANSDGEHYVSSKKKESYLCSDRYYDERHCTYSNCRMSFRRLKKFMSQNLEFWKDTVIYSDIQFISKRDDERWSCGVGVFFNEP